MAKVPFSEKSLTACSPSIETEILSLLSNTADGMFANDTTGRILIWNRASEEILGFSGEEVIGKRCFEILPGRDLAGNAFCFEGCSVVTMTKQSQLVKNYNVQMTTKSHEKIWLNTSIIVLSTQKLKHPIIVHLFRRILPPLSPEKRFARNATGIDGRQSMALSGGDDAASDSEIPHLAPREKDVLTLMAQCLIAKEIAQELHITTETARTHIQHILRKLKTHSKLEAVIIATQHGILSHDQLHTRHKKS